MNDVARPENPVPLAEADIYEACKAFVLAYALPELPPDNVIQGWQNRASLPPGTNDYAVISVLFDTQHGTAVESFAASDADRRSRIGAARSLHGSHTLASADGCKETFRADDPDAARPGILTIQGLIEAHVQIDICSETDAARQRATRLATVTRSSIGVRFFTDRGLSALYAEDVRDLSFVGDAKQFVRRCSTTLHLSYWSGDSVELPYFTTVNVARLEDVDAHHPVNTTTQE